MAIAPLEGNRTRLTGLVTCYGRRVGDPRAPASSFPAPMLGWALTFLVIALIAAALGFGGIAGASASIA